jgi:mono/diheme cytochrome c family protein
MPRWIIYVTVALVALSWVPLALIAKARETRNDSTRVHLVPDMDNQTKLKAQKSNPLFADGRANRMPIAGTVARGELRDDDLLHRGKTSNGAWADRFPTPVSLEMVQRGRDRFNIYCYPCHGESGYGNGPIAVRAAALEEGTWVPPSSLHDPVVIKRPVGHLFNSITNGIRNMPSYGDQISDADRWAIVAYVKALQKSQNAAVTLAAAGTP